MEFSVIREIIGQLNIPVNKMAALLKQPVKKPLPDGTFRWVFPLCTAEVVQVAKSVRMISGIRAALRLADDGFTTECLTLLRTVTDFSAEIIFIAEGIIQGSFNSSQKKFIDQYFKELPKNPVELAERERESYVTRREINKARLRLAEKANVNGSGLIYWVDFLNKYSDSYIHGAYETAMELYTGESHNFMLDGNKSEKVRNNVKVTIAVILGEVIAALEYMAATRGIDNLVIDLRSKRKKLINSEDYRGEQ